MRSALGSSARLAPRAFLAGLMSIAAVACAALLARASANDTLEAPRVPANDAPGDSLRRAADAADAPFCPVLIDTVIVTAPRPTRAQILLRESAFATFVPVAEIRAPMDGVAELLARTVGVQVQRYGGPGATATVSIRGADPGQVEVFLDRTPLRSASHSSVDLNAFDLAQIQSIEVYRSSPPTDLGGLAAGAAVRLVTPRSTFGSASARLATGSYGTREVAGLATGALGHGSRFLLSFSRFITQGDFLYHDNNGTTYESGDDAWRRWANGDIVRLSALGKFTFDLTRQLAFEWSSLYSQRQQGVPGSNGRPTEAVRLETTSLLHRGEFAATQFPHPNVDASLYGFTEGRDDLFKDPQRELDLTGSPRRVAQDETRRGVGVQGRWLLLTARRLLGVHGIELLAEVGREELHRVPPAGRPEEDQRRRSSRLLSLGDHWDLLQGALRVSAFYRWERSEDNFTGADPYGRFVAQAAHVATLAGPRFGVRATLGAGHVLKANRSRQGRFPTFAELFGHEGLVRGNATLEPEMGWRTDLGWCWSIDRGPLRTRLRLEQAIYQNELERMIVFILVSDRETKPFNLDRARIRGYEADITIENAPLLRELARVIPGDDALRADVSAHMTLQETRDEGISPIYNGKQLTYHPPAQGQAGCDIGWRGWQLGWTSQYRAGSYWSRSNLPAFQSPDQWSHDLTLRHRFGKSGLTAAVRIENLTAAELEDVRGYPLPGRAWFAEIEWRVQEHETDSADGAGGAMDQGMHASMEESHAHCE
jgi:vitamin B12 transporter